MTDRPIDPRERAAVDDEHVPALDALETRLDRHFAAEVHRAERDVRRGWLGRPVPTSARPGRRRRLAAVGSVLVAGVVIAAALGLQPSRIAHVGSSPIPPSGTVPTAPAPSEVAAITDTYPDGIPTTIDGRPVLRTAAAAARAASANDDSTFLVGGWFRFSYLFCSVDAVPYPSPFLWCNGSVLYDSSTTTGTNTLRITPDAVVIVPGAVVLEVHTHDPRAANCAAIRQDLCSKAVVVDRVAWQPVGTTTGPVVRARFPDGIPSNIDGVDVLRPADALAQASAATDASTFLVGGWRRGPVAYACPAMHLPLNETSPLVPRCGGYIIDEEPISGPTEAQVMLVGLRLTLPPEHGPAVFRVHVDDPLAADCTAADRLSCERALVVDAVVWTGDAVTATAPLTIQDVLLRLPDVSQGVLSATPFDATARRSGCDPGWPAQSWMASGALSLDPSIARILVFPRRADALATATRLRPDGYVGLPDPRGQTCALSIDGLMTSAWLVQDNVIVEVRYRVGPAPAFVGQVRHALATKP